MAYKEELAGRVRELLSTTKEVEEKKMFGGLAFMVDKKMCITIGIDRIMVRIDPALHTELVAREGCTPVIMRGREYKGFIHISEKAISRAKNLEDWVQLALKYNKVAKSSKE